MRVPPELTPRTEIIGLYDPSSKMTLGMSCPLCGERVIERTIDVSKIPQGELEATMVLAGLDDSEAYWTHLNTHGIYTEGGVAG